MTKKNYSKVNQTIKHKSNKKPKKQTIIKSLFSLGDRVENKNNHFVGEVIKIGKRMIQVRYDNGYVYFEEKADLAKIIPLSLYILYRKYIEPYNFATNKPFYIHGRGLLILMKKNPLIAKPFGMIIKGHDDFYEDYDFSNEAESMLKDNIIKFSKKDKNGDRYYILTNLGKQLAELTSSVR